MGIGAASTREYAGHFKILRWKSWKKYKAQSFQMTHSQVDDIVVRLLSGRRAQLCSHSGLLLLSPPGHFPEVGTQESPPNLRQTIQRALS